MSLFGASTSATPSSNIFGGGATGAAAGFGAASTPNLFGGGAAATPATGGFGFGAQSAPATGAAAAFGLGGSTPSTSAAGAFGFGAPAAPTPAPGAGGSLFGSAPAAPQPAPSMFGAPAVATPAPGGMFGAAAPATGGGLFGGGGAAAASPPAATPATPKPITGETKVSDLPPALQTELLAVERHLRDQRSKADRLLGRKASLSAQCKDLEARYGSMAQKATRGKAALDLLSARVETLRGATRVDHRATSAVLDALTATSAPVASSTAIVPAGYGWGRLDAGSAPDRAAHVPPGYFARVVSDLELRAGEYKREIDEVADYFRAQGHRLAGGAPASRFGAHRAQPQPRTRARSIEDVIRRQYDYFMVVATQVAVVHEAMRGFKGQYCAAIRMRDPDAVDPFEQADLREKAMAERRRYQAESAMQRALAGPGQQGGQPGQAAPGGMFGATPATGGGSLFGGGGFGATQAGAAGSQVSLFGGAGAGFGTGGTPGSNSLFGNSNGFGVTAGGDGGVGGFGTPGSRRLSAGRRKR